MPDWDTKDVKEWQTKSREEQQYFFTMLGDRLYDFIDYEELTILKKKVGYALFGPPGEVPDENKNNSIGYKPDQVKQIDMLTDKIREKARLEDHRSDIYFATIFISGKIFDKRFTEPVFRILKKEDTKRCYFIDTSGRVYEDWQDYLDHNKLPKCLYCYPRNGLYKGDDGNVILDCGTSPACDLVNRICTFFDYSSFAVSLGATAVGVTALFIPVAGPFITASVIGSVSTGVYGVGRSAHALYDRGTHDQSIGLDDSEARNCWIAIVGSTLGICAGAGTRLAADMAREGEVMVKAGRIAVNCLNIGSLTVNGIGVINGFVNIIDKAENNELTALDLFQFSASVLFFSNSLINYQTTGEIIREVQRDVLNKYKNSLSNKQERKMFRKLAKRTGGNKTGKKAMHGNAKMIRGLKRIANKEQFFQSLVDLDDQFTETNSTVTLTEEGLIDIDNQLVISPTKLVQINEDIRTEILLGTKKLSNNELTVDQFKTQMRSICKQANIKFECQRQETISKVCETFGTEKLEDIRIGGKQVFKKMTSHQIDRLGTVMENTTKGYNKSLIEIAQDFAAKNKCDNTGDFLSYTEFACHHIEEAKMEQYQKYLDARTEASKYSGFKQHAFDKEYGINGKVKDHFQAEAIKQFQTEEGLNSMLESFKDLKARCSVENQKGGPQFFNDNQATYHYHKHKEFNKDIKTEQQYFELARELTGKPVNEGNSVLSQEGNCTLITFKDDSKQCKAVLVRIHKENGQFKDGVATLFYERTI